MQGDPVAQSDRLYKLKSWLDAGRCVLPAQACAALEISRATFKRDLDHLRDRMNMPIVHSRERGGYLLDRSQQLVGAQYELPGLWFSAEEIHALLTMQHLLAHLDAGGLLGPHIEPLRKRLAQALGSGAPVPADVARRVRVLTVGARKLNLPHFQAVGTALLRRQRLVIDYLGRGSGQASEREVSPQRLVHYRDNWYLDAHCHWRAALRSFSVDAIRRVRIVERPAIDVPEPELDEVLGAGYGIFAGQAVQWATLRFAPDRARWVAAETWHPQQVGRWDADGRWLLSLPYADPRELLMDILRHVPEVEVLAPEELRGMVRERLEAGLRGWGLDE